jgi:hypothetical protein
MNKQNSDQQQKRAERPQVEQQDGKTRKAEVGKAIEADSPVAGLFEVYKFFEIGIYGEIDTIFVNRAPLGAAHGITENLAM